LGYELAWATREKGGNTAWKTMGNSACVYVCERISGISGCLREEKLWILPGRECVRQARLDGDCGGMSQLVLSAVCSLDSVVYMARPSRDLRVGIPVIFSRVCVCLSASEGWRSRSIEKGGVGERGSAS